MLAARFNRPDGLASDGTNLYVADLRNCTIRKVVIATGTVSTLAGSAGLCGSTDATGAAARFDHPHGLACDGTKGTTCWVPVVSSGAPVCYNDPGCNEDPSVSALLGKCVYGICVCNNGYVQPSVADLQKTRAIVGFVQHHNAIQPWAVNANGEVRNAINQA